MSTNAQMFCDALGARRWHQANNPRGVVPAQLEVDAIKAKYLVGARRPAMRAGTTGEPPIVFLDDSMAVRRTDGVWVTRLL